MQLLGISGKKQSGKDMLGGLLAGRALKAAGAVEDYRVTAEGELEILTEFSNGKMDWGILDVGRKDQTFIEAAEETIWPWTKIYSFADPLKQLAMDLFGLSYESVYGTDEQKNAPTHLLWENMPGVVTNGWLEDKDGKSMDEFGILHHEPGPMSGREFLQFFGTEIGRKIYEPIWINATMNTILAEKSNLALITDVRFPNEVKAIQSVGGQVLRLTREANDDPHVSELALDGYEGFDIVLDNANMTIQESCEAMLEMLGDLQPTRA